MTISIRRVMFLAAAALLAVTLQACKDRGRAGSGPGEVKGEGKAPSQETFDEAAWKDEPHPDGDAPRIDIAFCLDATGSMEKLIEAAKSRIKGIYKEIEAGQPRPSVRFAAVAYRDKGDEFVSRLYGFTTDPSKAERALGNIKATGGGDTPEHVVEGLRRAVNALGWDPSAKLRFLFLLGDAPPHLDYGAESDVAPVLKAAKEKNIIIGAVVYGDSMSPEGKAFWKKVADETGGPSEGVALKGEMTLESMLLEAIRREALKQGIVY